MKSRRLKHFATTTALQDFQIANRAFPTKGKYDRARHWRGISFADLKRLIRGTLHVPRCGVSAGRVENAIYVLGIDVLKELARFIGRNRDELDVSTFRFHPRFRLQQAQIAFRLLERSAM